MAGPHNLVTRSGNKTISCVLATRLTAYGSQSVSCIGDRGVNVRTFSGLVVMDTQGFTYMRASTVCFCFRYPFLVSIIFVYPMMQCRALLFVKVVVPIQQVLFALFSGRVLVSNEFNGPPKCLGTGCFVARRRCMYIHRMYTYMSFT